MLEQGTRYGMRTTVELPFELALDRTRKALAREGFGIVSEIDMAATLKQKLDVMFRPYFFEDANLRWMSSSFSTIASPCWAT